MGESSASAAVANPGLKQSWTTAVVWPSRKPKEVTAMETLVYWRCQDHRTTTKGGVSCQMNMVWDKETSCTGCKWWSQVVALSKLFAAQKIMSEWIPDVMRRHRAFCWSLVLFYFIIAVLRFFFPLKINYIIYFRFYRNPPLETLNF